LITVFNQVLSLGMGCQSLSMYASRTPSDAWIDEMHTILTSLVIITTIVVCWLGLCAWRVLLQRGGASKQLQLNELQNPLVQSQISAKPVPMFACDHAYYRAAVELESWTDMVGRMYEVDFVPGVPGSVPVRPLPELEKWLCICSEQAENCGAHEPIDWIWSSRALVATDFKATEASEITKSYVAWRCQNPGITVPMLAWINFAIVIVPFEDKFGRPVAISRLRSYHKGLPLSLMTNGYRATADGVIAHLLRKRDVTPSRTNPLEQWILCIDCEGIGWSNFSIEVVKMFISESKHRYMDRIAAIYMLNPPSIWGLMWSMMRPMLAPRTLRKIKLVPAAQVSATMCDLMGARADELLPKSYGGSARPIPPPGQGVTLEEKVGGLLAETWMSLRAVESEAYSIEEDKDQAASDFQQSSLSAAFLCCGAPHKLGRQDSSSRRRSSTGQGRFARQQRRAATL